MELFNQLNSEATANGAEFVGSVVFLSVQQETNIALGSLVREMQLHPEIPSDWAPEPLNHLSLYLQTISGLGRGGANKFKGMPDTHGGYTVHRLFLRSESDMPAAHKVFALRRIMGADGKLADVEVDSGIIISLRRTYGDKSTDKTGLSMFAVDVQGAMTPEYEVFVQTLLSQFEMVRDERYTADQVRSLLIDILKDKLNAVPIKRGDYFVEGRSVNALEALREVFTRVDEGVRINPLHIVKYAGAQALNQSFSSLAGAVQESVVKEMQGFLEELNHLDTKDSKTRAGTWQDRHDKFMDLQLRIKRLQSKQLIENDILTDMAQEALDILGRYDEAV
jgi:hypothetical protein